MVKSISFQITDILCENHSSIIYRAQLDQQDQCVILKILNAKYPDRDMIQRLRQEYSLISLLNTTLSQPWVIKVLDLILDDVNGIMLEDFGGISLDILSRTRSWSLPDFLVLALQITEALAQVHQCQVIHKDINPSNITLNPITGQLKLIDFNIAHCLSRDNTDWLQLNRHEGTLSYIAPEQTGRLDHGVDYRADLYSLGITFYELLTQQLPFKSQEPMALIYSHIAESAIPPHEVNPKIPQGLSQIVMKLIEKDPASRYQNAWGLKQDLDYCLQQLQDQACIQVFPLASYDSSDILQIPETLYGCDLQKEQLNQALALAREGSQPFVLVSGYSGMGKSSLVQNHFYPLADEDIKFAYGKCDLQTIPYAGIIKALRLLVCQILTAPEADLQAWRSKLLELLGDQSQIIVDLIPELAIMIGTPAKPRVVGSLERQNRLNRLLQQFISIFISPQQPLVLFIDDLQWADTATLHFLRYLIQSQELPHCLIIGAYRIQDRSHQTAIAELKEDLQSSQLMIEITLDRLQPETINEFIADSLKMAPTACLSLVRCIDQQTAGNPYFIKEFLRSIHQKQLLTYNHQTQSWDWDLNGIYQCGITDNVVDLLTQKIQELPASIQHVLKRAACIGNHFDLYTLAQLSNLQPKETLAILRVAVKETLITPEYSLLQESSSSLDADGMAERVSTLDYKFAHDRVHQAVYSLMTESEQSQIHYQLGYLLLEQVDLTTAGDPVDERIFKIVGHLNRCISSITHDVEYFELARLNLQAGRRAMLTAAYEPALAYLQMGIQLLRPNTWSSHYDLTLNLYNEAIEAASICTHFDLMDQMVDCILQHAHSDLEKVTAYVVRINALIAQSKRLEAIHTTLSILKGLGINLPQKPNIIHIVSSLYKTQWLLRTKTVKTLEQLPHMHNDKMLVAMKLFAAISPAAYYSLPNLLPLIAFKQVQLSLNYGITPATAHAFAAYGMILCSILNQIRPGYEFGTLSKSLLQASTDPTLEAQTLFLNYAFIDHWVVPLKDTTEALFQLYQHCFDQGSYDTAANLITMRNVHLYCSGQDLLLSRAVFSNYTQVLMKLKQEPTVIMHQIYNQTIANWIEPSSKPYQLKGAAYDEDDRLPQLVQLNDRTNLFVFYLNKLILAYSFGCYSEALDFAGAADRYKSSAVGAVTIPVYFFYFSLTLLALATQTNWLTRIKYIVTVMRWLPQLKQWALHGSCNISHKYYLIKAEFNRVIGHHDQAMNDYEQAIKAARTHLYLQEEAMANELAAKFYLSKRNFTIAKIYMLRSHYCYQLWGSHAKVVKIERDYPDFFLNQLYELREEAYQHKNVSTTFNHKNSLIDLKTMINASQAISDEIQLDRLLDRLLQALSQNAGAQQSYLVLDLGDQGLHVAAHVTGETDDQLLEKPLAPLETMQPYQQIVITYILRTRESLVLNDFQNDIKQDPYTFLDMNGDLKSEVVLPKSVLCKPLINQGQLLGVLYLENTLVTGAFTQDRLTLINLLSTQAAISIKVARQYQIQAELNDQLQQLNQAYARFVPNQFLNYLDKQSIVDVQLGDRVQREMTVLFCDIYDFTASSEQMDSVETFEFINDYLSLMETMITQHEGFIDKYIGDEIMALFPGSADQALMAAIHMVETLATFNQTRQLQHKLPIKVGIGINTGILMLGVVGGAKRMDTTVISDAVNLASRIERLTRNYELSILITQHTYQKLSHPTPFKIRLIDQISVRGREEQTIVYEVFEADAEPQRSQKQLTKPIFETAIKLFYQNQILEAIPLFQQCLRQFPQDQVAQKYLAHCYALIEVSS